MYPQPNLVPINNKEYYLKEPYTHEWILENKKFRVTVPQGFITDGASVPKLFWSIAGLKPDGLYRAAAVVHDYFYAFRGDPPSESFQKLVNETWKTVTKEDRPALTRKEIDGLFIQIMQEAGVDGWASKSMYWAVRVFGRFAW